MSSRKLSIRIKLSETKSLCSVLSSSFDLPDIVAVLPKQFKILFYIQEVVGIVINLYHKYVYTLRQHEVWRRIEVFSSKTNI